MTDRCKASGRGGRAIVRPPWLSSLFVVVPGHARHRTRRRPGNGGSPGHDQANLARSGPCGLSRWRGRRVQHPGCDVQSRGGGPVDRPGFGPGRVRTGRLGGRSELLLARRGQDAPDRSVRGVSVSRVRSCNARAIRPCGGRRMSATCRDRCCDRLRRRREEYLRRRGDRGPLAAPGSVPVRPSGNAALGETMTSTAPHLSVQAIGRAQRRGRPAGPAVCPGPVRRRTKRPARG
jgi:hypothetical protein